MAVRILHWSGRHDAHYTRAEYYCPNCGQRDTVWVESYADGQLADGDYYVGPSYYCVGCDHEFTMQGPNEESNKEFMMRLKAAAGA